MTSPFLVRLAAGLFDFVKGCSPDSVSEGDEGNGTETNSGSAYTASLPSDPMISAEPPLRPNRLLASPPPPSLYGEQKVRDLGGPPPIVTTDEAAREWATNRAVESYVRNYFRDDSYHYAHPLVGTDYPVSPDRPLYPSLYADRIPAIESIMAEIARDTRNNPLRVTYTVGGQPCFLEIDRKAATAAFLKQLAAVSAADREVAEGMAELECN